MMPELKAWRISERMDIKDLLLMIGVFAALIIAHRIILPRIGAPT